MSEEKRRPGRPATGETPPRKVRIEDEIWDEVERLAGELAALNGVKRNVTAYVKEALRRENQRVERLIAKVRAEQKRTEQAAAAPVTSELTSDQARMMAHVRRGSIQHDGKEPIRWGTNGFFQDLSRGDRLMLDTLLAAGMVGPEPLREEYGVYRVYRLADKGKATLLDWERAQEQAD